MLAFGSEKALDPRWRGRGLAFVQHLAPFLVGQPVLGRPRELIVRKDTSLGDLQIERAVLVDHDAIRHVAAAEAVDTGAGVLFIVKNYSGDVMNFELAADMAREEGVRVLSILIGWLL